MPDAPERAVVLLSGGIDSATTLAIAIDEGRECHALSFDYGQRHLIELDSAGKVAEALGAASHQVVKLDLSGFRTSALISASGIEVPKGGRSGEIPVTYVPARNTIFLSFALGLAEVIGAWHIYIGANALDYSGYPDCRPGYLEAFERMANLAAKASVEGRGSFRVHAPLISLAKPEIIKRGLDLGLDYSITWSCYDPGPGGSPCGMCDSCRIRSKGMKEAGLPEKG